MTQNLPAPPLWSALPFVCMLLAIAVLPLRAPHWWENNRHRALVAALLGLPVVVWLGLTQPHVLGHTFAEYAAFIILLASLYVIASGIVVQGSLQATPSVNTVILLGGGVLASMIGTTGASMLLIRPLLRANAGRQRAAHVVVFFIFIVSNAGGLLTPLGDPPLFLGYLRGVPFTWTLRLWPQWLFVNGLLALLFFAFDHAVTTRDGAAPAPALDTPLSLRGQHNILCLVALVALIVTAGAYHLPTGVQELGMLALAAASWRSTPATLRVANAFEWGPMVEVAVVFAGIFATMQPALLLLNAHGAELGVREPWQFFWLTGLLSSCLDNAPTYLSFTATASALLGTQAQDLTGLIARPKGEALLAAISAGAVMMGANTYIGNGPNFMVRAVAERSGVRMPSFFGYMAYSGVVLLPVFVLVTKMFFL